MIKMAIIGNGVTSKPIGNIIDDCDRVVRCNGFKIKGYEKYIGTKIDIVALIPTGDGCVQVIKEINPTVIKSTKEFWFSRPVSQCKNHYKSLLKKINIYSLEYETLHPSWEHWLKILSKLKRNNIKNLWPSTGFVAIEMAINLFPSCQIYITGFDQFKTGHYYNTKNIWGTAHPLLAEKRCINAYIESKKIIRLS